MSDITISFWLIQALDLWKLKKQMFGTEMFACFQLWTVLMSCWVIFILIFMPGQLLDISLACFSWNAHFLLYKEMTCLLCKQRRKIWSHLRYSSSKWMHLFKWCTPGNSHFRSIFWFLTLLWSRLFRIVLCIVSVAAKGLIVN